MLTPTGVPLVLNPAVPRGMSFQLNGSLVLNPKDVYDFGTVYIAPGLLQPEALTNAGDPISLTDVADSATSPEPTSTPGETTRMAKQNVMKVPNPRTGQDEPQFIDVEFHGVVVPLLEVRRALRGDKKLRQEDIAALTANYTPDKRALHQTSVSNYFLGKVPMHDAVVSLLEATFTPAEAQSMATKSPLMSAPVPTPQVSGLTTADLVDPKTAGVLTTAMLEQAEQERQKALQTGRVNTASPTFQNIPVPRTAGAPAFAQTLSAVGGGAPLSPDATVVPQAPTTQTHTVAVKALQPFPMDKAHELAAGVRTAERKGDVTTTFSLRKLVAWGRAYYLLQQEGYDPKEALSGAFHLAAEGKTYGEDRTFLKNLFQAKFGFESKPPRENSRVALSEGRHPMSYLIEPLVREGMHVWLHGPTGAGKTHSVFDIAARLNRKVVRFQGKGDATTDDFVGGFGLKSENGASVTEFQYGPLPKAMMEGSLLNIDEITTLPAEVLFELQAVLEGKPLVLTKNRGEEILPAPGFAVVAADNTLGLGEAPAYVGTNVMNEAFRDRFFFIEYGYMPDAMEKRALKSELEAFFNPRGWAVA